MKCAYIVVVPKYSHIYVSSPSSDVVKIFLIEQGSKFVHQHLYSTTRFKLYACKYILTSINTFSPSSQPMLASKGSILSSKGNMLSCTILLAIEIDIRVQLLARIRHRAVSRCTQARLHALVHYFTRDLI